MPMTEALVGAFLISGSLVMLLGAAGVARFPDFYTRLHAAGKGDTLGQLLILGGLMIAAGVSLESVKLGMIIFFVMICNPTATHALGRVAWQLGIRPALGEEPAHVEQREGELETHQAREALILSEEAILSASRGDP